MEVLSGLDAYREGGPGGTPSSAEVNAASAAVTSSPPPREKSPTASPRRSSVTATSDDDDDDDMFGGDGTKMLDISIDATALSAAQKRSSEPASPEFGSGAAKRRRSSAAAPVSSVNGTTAASSAVGITKKPKALSTQNFLDLFQSIASLDERYMSSLGVVEGIPPSYLDEDSADVDDLVGDELTEMYKKVCSAQRNVRRERKAMYGVALQRRELEKEARRYVGWLKNLAKVDDDDLEFVDKLEKKLDMISVCHGKYHFFHFCSCDMCHSVFVHNLNNCLFFLLFNCPINT